MTNEIAVSTSYGVSVDLAYLICYESNTALEKEMKKGINFPLLSNIQKCLCFFLASLTITDKTDFLLGHLAQKEIFAS